MIQRTIVGIVLVQNEEAFVAQAISNILDFCDKILLVDHHSLDQTPEILEGFAQQYPQKISFHRINDPAESHQLLQPYVGTPTWVFGVDGDELYDREGLARFRPRLLAGEWTDFWMILGNVCHVDQLDRALGKGWGFLAPPSRSMTKLYNFDLLKSWEGSTPERLHGGIPLFKESCFSEGRCEPQKYLFYEEASWEEASFRALHLCFLRRSSYDTTEIRKNIMDQRRLVSRFRFLQPLLGVWHFLRGKKFLQEEQDWKRERYARGPHTEVSLIPFFVRNDFCS